MSRDHPAPTPTPCPWDEIPARLRAAGMRWTPQRRTLVRVLQSIEGHVSAAELVERCRAEDATTTPSTVYRTLDVLEDLGVVCHGHDGSGREEYHVLPQDAHGHIYCEGCTAVWEIRGEVADEVQGLLERQLGFEIDLSHVTISGRCRGCRDSN
jgi:Fur family transcriptional regulator, ferric uptake regulator